MTSIPMLCTQFYCNAPTHQESVWIHISVVGRSHFVITPPPPQVKIDMSAPADNFICQGESVAIQWIKQDVEEE